MRANRSRRAIQLWACLGIAAPAVGQTVAWNLGTNGTFNVSSNWNPATVPGAGSISVFAPASTYSVTFNAAANNLSSFVNAGNVSFIGQQSFTLSSTLAANGGSLSLNGTDVTTGAAIVNGNSRLTLFSTSQLDADDVSVGTTAGTNGTLLVSSGTLSSTGAMSLGLSGGDGTVAMTGAATGTLSQVSLAASGVAGSGGTMTIANTSAVVIGGSILVGTGGQASQVGFLRMSDSSSVTQTGATSIAVGAASNNVATLDVAGGTFTSGTGTLSINPTGVLRVSGTYNANHGTIDIRGGTLDFSTGQFNSANNQIVDLTNGATVLSNAGLIVANGGKWNVAASTVSGTSAVGVQIGNVGNGTMSFDAGTFNTNGGSVTLAAAGTFAELSLLNGSVGSFGALVGSNAGTPAIIVSGGSTINCSSMSFGGAAASVSIATGGKIFMPGRISLSGGGVSVSDSASRLSAGSLDLQSSATITQSGGSISFGAGSSSVAGTINVSGGSIGFGGGLNINAGDIVVSSPGTLRPLTGATLLNNSRLTAPGIVISAASFQASNDSQITSGGGVSFFGAQAVLQSGADLAAVQVDVGFASGGASTLSVRNPGTTVSSTQVTRLGGLGQASLLFADGAVGTFNGGIAMLDVVGAGGIVSSANLVVDSSAAIVLADDLIAARTVDFTGATPANIAISGGGRITMVGPAAELIVGCANPASLDAGTLTVDAGGTFLMDPAATVSLNATGTIIVNGGECRLGTFTADPAGHILFNSGTLGTNGLLNIAPTGALGNSLNLGADRALFHDGTLAISTGGVTLSGGTLSVGTFGASTVGLSFQSGALRVTGAGGFAIAPGQMLGSALTLEANRSLSVTNNLSIAPGGQLHIAGGTVSAGSTSVDGLLDYTSGFVSTGPLVIGSSGRAIVGPSVSLDTSGASSNAGRLELAGGVARIGGAGSLTNNGLIAGDGEIALPLINSAGGELRADAGDTLAITGNFLSNAGRITVNGGRVDLSLPHVNNGSIDLTGGVLSAANALTNAGRITGRGTLRSDNSINNTGTITLSGGVSDVNAPTLSNSGKTIITGGGVTTFFGAVNNTVGSELRVSTSSTAVFLGDVTGASLITGGGLKIFEANASGLLETPGDSVVESAGRLSLAHIREHSLTINGGRVDVLADGTPAGASRLNELLIAGTPGELDGQFDLSNNALVIDYASSSPRATVGDYVSTGFAGGAWTGQGISSSAAASQPNRAIGIAEASDISSPATFVGQPIDMTSLLLRFTLPGDTNLDHAVNISDFSLLAANFNLPSYWARGDFNFDATTGIGDFALLASNFNLVLATDAPGLRLVPEPTLIGWVLAGASLLSRRRNGQFRMLPRVPGSLVSTA